MTRIGIDLRYTSTTAMGTGTYAETATLDLVKRVNGNHCLIGFAGDGPWSKSLRTIARVRVPTPTPCRDRDLAEQLAWDAAIDRAGLGLFWAPTGIAPRWARCPVVLTIHDLAFRHHPEWYDPRLRDYLERTVVSSIRRADGIIAISEATRRDLLQMGLAPPNRVQVIHQSVQARYLQTVPVPGERASVLGQRGIAGPYVLVVSNHAPHKNTIFAIRCYARWVANHPQRPHLLVLAGGGPAPHPPVDLASAIAEHGIADRTRILGRVSDEELQILYASASVLLMPSLFEGWGLPPVEALALGTPSIVSDRGGLPEAVGDAATILPLELDLWAEALDVTVNGPDERQREAMFMRRAQLTTGAGERLLSWFDEVAAMPRRAHSERASSPSSSSTVSHSGSDSFTHRSSISKTDISGCTIVRNGIKLRYPFEESIASYLPVCDELILCWDPTSEDGTRELVERLARLHPEIVLVESAWNISNRSGGSELAHQTQVAFTRCRCPWTLYVQADEAIHEAGHEELVTLTQDQNLTGVTFERRSFLGTLDREIPAHRVTGLLRLFRTGAGTSVGDAMQVQLKIPGRVVSSRVEMFNYSRLGDDRDIVARSRNLHTFYHEDAALSQLPENEHHRLETIAYLGTHPAPIENTFRHQTETPAALATSPSSGTTPARIAVNMIARETDAFGADLIASSLESLEGYADQIIIVDNGLSAGVLAIIGEMRKRLPIELHDGRGIRSYSELRNRALSATDRSMTHVHKIDTDEVYAPASLTELKRMLRDPDLSEVSATFVHFMIDPSLVESQQRKEVVFRYHPDLAWSGAVHEKPQGLAHGIKAVGPAMFLHLGYCRPQWQTFLKWLRYAYLEVGSLSHYVNEFIDGVRLPWFRGGRTPNTVLETRRAHLTRFTGPYVHTMAPWLEAFARSRQPWTEWITEHADPDLWAEWKALASGRVWEDTLEPMLRRSHPDLFRTELASAP